MKLHLGATLLGALALLSLSSPASALGTHIYSVTLNGANEVPASGSAGTGTATVTLDDVTGAVSVSGSYTGLGSNATAAHIHGPAPAGVNAGVIVGLSVSGGTAGTFSGAGVLTPTQVGNMLGGLTYLNVHTVGFGGGEIRGQITLAVPALSWAWLSALAGSALLAGTWVLRRRA